MGNKKDLNYWKNNAEEDYLHTPISVLKYINKLEKELKQAINYTHSSTQLPTKKEINIEAQKHSPVNGIICEDEYWVIAKNESFIDGALWCKNKVKNKL